MDAVKTVVEFGTRYVPLREALDQIGGTVAWDNQTKQATIEANGRTILVTMEQSTAQIQGGETVTLSATPLVKQGELLVPEDFFTSAVGQDVYLA